MKNIIFVLSLFLLIGFLLFCSTENEPLEYGLSSQIQLFEKELNKIEFENYSLALEIKNISFFENLKELKGIESIEQRKNYLNSDVVKAQSFIDLKHLNEQEEKIFQSYFKVLREFDGIQ